MDPETLRVWRDVVLGFVLIALGVFVTVFAVVKIQDATRLGVVLGFAATLLGIPATVRLDAARRHQERDQEMSHEDRWSGLP